jgi:hypothetical protein
MISKLCGTVLLSIGFLISIVNDSHAFVDDFNDGDDSGWTRFDPVAGLGIAPESEFTFPDGAYRMVSFPPAIGDAGPARTFAIREDQEFSDFYIAVDVLDWNNNINQAFGIFARAENVGLGQTTGYICNYDPNQRGGRPGGEFQINRVTDEAASGTLARAGINLTPDRNFRFVFTGVGPSFTASVYDLEDLTQPIVTITAGGEDDRATTYTTGVVGLFNFYRDDSTDPIGIPDITWDNFVALDAPPVDVSAPAAPHGVPATPQVFARTPVSNAAFHPAEDGIQFSLGTLTDSGVAADAVKMLLNGGDVTSQLSIDDTDPRIKVAYDGLEVNQVYHARVEMESRQGVPAVHQWYFDTFTQEFIDGEEVTVIEVEDFNYQAGQFQNNPPPSGFTFEFVQINGNGVGYLDLPGINGIDYFDYEETPPAGGTSYRLEDLVSTQSELGGEDIAPSPPPIMFDVLRAKYESTGVPEYQVWQTQAGEWLNYTRDFEEQTYLVYLRAACRVPQTIHFDRITGDRTVENQTKEPIGVIQMQNTITPLVSRFFPLTDESGKVLSISLSGTETLRMTLGGEAQDYKFRTTAYLNYLLFIPSVASSDPVVVLESSTNPAGGYQDQTDALLDSNAGTFTLDLPQSNQFYRLRLENSDNGTLRIDRVFKSAADPELVIKFNIQ